MTQEEADEIILYLREVMDDLEPILLQLVHGGFDNINQDIVDAVVSMHAACVRLEETFPWNDQKDQE